MFVKKPLALPDHTLLLIIHHETIHSIVNFRVLFNPKGLGKKLNKYLKHHWYVTYQANHQLYDCIKCTEHSTAEYVKYVEWLPPNGRGPQVSQKVLTELTRLYRMGNMKCTLHTLTVSYSYTLYNLAWCIVDTPVCCLISRLLGGGKYTQYPTLGTRGRHICPCTLY